MLHLKEKVHPYLSITVLIWAVVITGILTAVYYDMQHHRDRSRILNPTVPAAPEESAEQDTSAQPSPERALY